MKNYDEKLNQMRADLRRKEIAVEVLRKLEDNMQWNMERVEDDSEEGYHYEAPAEDSWQYPYYSTWKEAFDVLDKHFFGK